MEYSSLAALLAERLNISLKEVDAMCDSFSEVLGEAGADLDSVAIPTFGIFEPRRRTERIAVNPSSGKRILYPPKIGLSFRPSAILRKKVRELDGKGDDK